VVEADREEHRASALAVVAPKLEVILVPRHPGHDIADSAPSVEAVVQHPELGLARLEGEEAEDGVEQKDSEDCFIFIVHP
jgi:hypothetical protein